MKKTPITLEFPTDVLAELDGLTARLGAEGYYDTVRAGLAALRGTLDGLERQVDPLARLRTITGAVTHVLASMACWAVVGLVIVSIGRCALS